jgi:TonB-linked SusC/RagA family outer membrane protein
MLSFALGAQAQYQVRGVISDDLGPVIGATVMEAGTQNGTSTDFDGNFSLNVTGPDAMVEVSCIGYATQTYPAKDFPSSILLKEDVNFLDEVVVVGYGTQKSKDLTAPIVTVKGDELAKQVSANPMSAIQGMMSGVQVIQSGAPGAGPSVKIRGVGSIGDYAKPLYVVDGVFVDNIDFLSGNDIESLTVLKDASASAIYGVRAANGVVLVTTRKGSHGHVNVAYDGYAGVQIPTHIMKLTNTAQYVQLMNEANANTIGYKPIDASYYTGDTDWYAALVHPALTHSHSIDLSGANDGTNYSIGLSYFYQDGIMNYAKNDYNRLNFRARLDQKATEWLTVGFNNVLSRYTQNNADTGAYEQAFINPPVYNIYNEANTAAYPEKFDSPQLYGFGNSYGNPVARAFYQRNYGSGLKDVFSVYADFTIIPDILKFKTSYNLDFDFYDGQNYTPEYYVGGSQGTKTSSLSKTFGYGTYQILDNVLTYNGSSGRNSWSVMLGQSTRWQFNSSLTGISYNVPDFDDASRYLINGSPRTRMASDGASRYHGLSAFTRATFNHADKYLATLTFRADGSSKYQQKWGFFPSLGLGWNISNEGFMQNQNVFDFLKMRASWGMLGNDNVPANSTLIVGASGMGASGVFGDDNVIDGVGAQTVFQNSLKWEVVTEFNVGFDMAFLKNRLTAEIDYYHRTTNNVVFYAPIATGGGTATLLANNGKVLNQGVEMALNWADQVGDFGYSLNFNATTISNKVLELNGRSEIPGAEVNGVYSTSTRVGYPIGSFWGYKIDGVYESDKEAIKDPVSQTIKEAGFFKYKDLDGNQQINDNDRTYLGAPIPWLILGFNTSVNWRNFDFAMLLNAQVGNKILNRKRMNRSVFPDGNYDLDFYNNRWTKDNRSDKYPSADAYGTNFVQQANEFFVEDGSFFRIQNIQIGYTFKKIPGIKGLRTYLSAQRPLSLFRYNGFTTEIGGSPIESGIDSSVYPMQSIWTAGINLNF